MLTDGPVLDPSLFVGKFNLGYDYVWLLESGTIHLFDLARFLMGPVVRLQAVGVNKYHRNRLGYPLENVAATLEFASGAVGSLTTSATALSFKPWERVEVYGNKRWLAVEDQLELILYDEEEGPAKHWRPAMPNTLFFDEEFGGYTGMIENFLQAVRGLAAPGATGWDGYHAYELNVATHLSIARRQPVELPLAAPAADAELADWLKLA
jgi:predicted dehydrogenase